MFASWQSFSLYGMEAVPINIEADLIYQLPSFNIVGLASSQLKEARERVRSAIKNSGFDFPIRRITVNLSPATLKKERISLDLPIALSILEASEQFRRRKNLKLMAFGELSLDGSVNPCPGTLISLLAAVKQRPDAVILPRIQSCYKDLISSIDFPFSIISVDHLKDAVELIESNLIETDLRFQRSLDENLDFSNSALNTTATLNASHEFDHEPASNGSVSELEAEFETIKEDFEDLWGLESPKRALMIAALGGHHLLLAGPRGSGKSALSNRFQALLPPLNSKQKLEIAAIQDSQNSSILEGSSSQDSDSKSFLTHSKPPLRKPHSGITHAAMFGGGNPFSPGEISLSHHGLLYLDEFQDFKKEVIESLRQPLQEKKLTISRAKTKVSMNCGFQLLCTMNLCPCGAKGSWNEPCHCSSASLEKFRSRISEAILDRIPLRIVVQKTDFSKTEVNDFKENKILSTMEMKGILDLARKFRQNRPAFKIDVRGFEKIKKVAKVNFKKRDLSNRSISNSLLVARSIADLEHSDSILEAHMLEALWLSKNPFEN